VLLLDNGLMAPDMVQGDGVYSRAVPYLDGGKYSVRVNVQGVSGQHKFERNIRLGIINVFATSENRDILSPARIVDLRTSVLPGTLNQVSFTWTAPGDDYDFGTANKYVVKIGNTPDLQESTSYLNDWPAPLSAFTIQQHTITWTNYDVASFIGIYAVDSAGNASPLSNTVSVFIRAPPSTTEYPPTPSSLDVESSGVRDKSSGLTGEANLKLMVIGTAVFVVVCIIIGVIYFICAARKDKNRKNDLDNSMLNKPGMLHNNKNGSDLSSLDGAGKKEYMSPVESWTASQLLNGHQDSKRISFSAGSDGVSDHSESTKKSFTGISATNGYYGNSPQYQYDATDYPQNYPHHAGGYSTPPEEYFTSNGEYHPEGYPVSDEHRQFNSPPSSENFLSVSCDMIPGKYGPPGYTPYDEHDLRGGKVPPPIPPKPKAVYPPEPYQLEQPDCPSITPSAEGTEKRIRNVTMV